MDLVFKALADPTRREILDRLYTHPGVVLTELIHGLGMRRQSASRHITVLEEAGLIQTQWRGREKLHYLNPVPISEIGHRWIDKFSQNKLDAVINLKQALEDKDNE